MPAYVSAGVYVREIDLSLYVPALSTTIVGMVGRATKGPTNTRTYVTNQTQFVEVFGNPDSTIGYESYAALQYLRRGRQLWFVRIVGESAAAAEYTAQMATEVEDETIDDTPNGVLKEFSGTLDNGAEGIVPSTITITATVGASPVTITDDGAGALAGTGVTGTITYSTGAWTLVFTTEPDDTTDILADYSYYEDAFVATMVSEGEWGNDISIAISDGRDDDTFKITLYKDEYPIEKFDNLDLDSTSDNYIETRINDISDYITVDVDAGVTGTELPVNVTTPVAFTGGDSDAENVAADDIVGVAFDETLAQPTGLQLFASPNAVDVNLLACPGWSDSAVVVELLAIAEARADCMAIIDPPESLTPAEVVDWHNGQGDYDGLHAAFSSSYGALYWPWIKIYDAYNAQYVYAPPSGHALAAYAYTDYVGETWFAPAGVRRGQVLSGIDAEYDPSRGEMDLLYGDGNAVNPIERFTKDGLVIWGQRTLQRIPTALDRVNVRRLLLYLRKVIATATRALVFEPNDHKTWVQFGQLVTPFLNDVKQRRGLYDFRVKCDETTNTPAVIDRNEMHAQIFLKPVKAAEFIQVDLVITATGANFDEILY